jgi:RimJ/RimL family protein N-acetyltransferase
MLNTDAMVMKFYPEFVRAVSPDDLFRRNQQRFEVDGYGFLLVEDKKTGAFLGQAGLLKQELEGGSHVEVAYQLKRAAWGHGYATEAATACRDHAFRQLRQAAVISIINRANAASIAVARRLGMTLLKETKKWDQPVSVFAIDRETWRRVAA